MYWIACPFAPGYSSVKHSHRSPATRDANAQSSAKCGLNWRVYLTFPFKCSARSRHAAPRRTDVRDDLKPGYPTLLVSHRFPLPASSRPDKEGDAGATRRASATRSHEPSRGIKRVLDSSLSRQTNGSHESLLRGPSSFLHLHFHLHVRHHLWQHTLPLLPLSFSLFLLLSGGSFLREPSRALTRGLSRPTSARILERASVLTPHESLEYFNV